MRLSLAGSCPALTSTSALTSTLSASPKAIPIAVAAAPITTPARNTHPSVAPPHTCSNSSDDRDRASTSPFPSTGREPPEWENKTDPSSSETIFGLLLGLGTHSWANRMPLPAATAPAKTPRRNTSAKVIPSLLISGILAILRTSLFHDPRPSSHCSSVRHSGPIAVSRCPKNAWQGGGRPPPSPRLAPPQQQPLPLPPKEPTP